MKLKILKYVTSLSRYVNGRFFDLAVPAEVDKKTPKAKGVSMGADAKGFFVYTHRARSHSYATPNAIQKKDIIWIETTG